MKTDPVINGFSTNEVTSHFHICEHSIVNFGQRGFCLGFSYTYRVDNLDSFIKVVVDKVNLEIYIYIYFQIDLINNYFYKTV